LAPASTSTCVMSGNSASTTIRRTPLRGGCRNTRSPMRKSNTALRGAGRPRSRCATFSTRITSAMARPPVRPRTARFLRPLAPRLEVDALVYDDTAPMLDGHPALAQLHTVGRNWRALGAWGQLSEERALLRRLRARGYDLVVHLTEHPRGAWLSRLLRGHYSVAPVMVDRGRWW